LGTEVNSQPITQSGSEKVAETDVIDNDVMHRPRQRQARVDDTLPTIEEEGVKDWKTKEEVARKYHAGQRQAQDSQTVPGQTTAILLPLEMRRTGLNPLS